MAFRQQISFSSLNATEFEYWRMTPPDTPEQFVLEVAERHRQDPNDLTTILCATSAWTEHRYMLPRYIEHASQVEHDQWATRIRISADLHMKIAYEAIRERDAP